VRILYFGTYDREHPRNINAIAALRAAGVEVVERHRQLGRGGLRGTLDVILAETRLSTPGRKGAEALVVGYPGHFDVPRARRLAGPRPLVFDAVLSLEDELVSVRQRFRPHSTAANVLRVADARALRLPDLVVCGTEAEAGYLRSLGAERTAVVFLGADEGTFTEGWTPTQPFSALHEADGSSDVVEAAAGLVPDVPVRSVGRRELEPYEQGLAFARAGIVLGSFRDSRAIAPAVFAALAIGAPVVTADTAASRELLRDEESALLVPPESPEAIAAAIARLARDEELRTAIAAAGRRVYAEHAACIVRGHQWRALIEQLLSRRQ
jgi:glycosyltransferase involved in cell wall biosynthesis